MADGPDGGDLLKTHLCGWPGSADEQRAAAMAGHPSKAITRAAAILWPLRTAAASRRATRIEGWRRWRSGTFGGRRRASCPFQTPRVSAAPWEAALLLWMQ